MRNLFLLTLLLFSGAVSAAFDPATCAQTNIRCIGDGMEYDTDNGTGDDSPIFQTAINASAPGDTIVLRGGTYNHAVSSSNLYFAEVDVSGTAQNPIVITGAEDETAHIVGFGYPEDGSDPGREDEEIFRVNGDYIHFKDFEISYSSRFGITLNGNHGLVENMYIHDNWHDGVTIGRTGTAVTGNTVRYSEFHNMRHGSGVILSRGSNDTNPISYSLVEYNISYNNGYMPNGQKVPAVTGDVAGGGNSDGFGVTKNCNDVAAAGENNCPNNTYQYNIAWHNADDGFDFSFGGGSKVVGNISFNNGPEGNRGFKVLRNVSGGLTFIGNISINNVHPSSRGLELRFNESGNMFHNIAMREGAHGLYVSATVPSGIRVHNNIEFDNGNGPAITSGVTNTNNSTSVTPQITNTNFQYADINTNPSASTILERRNLIFNQVKNALLPTVGSPLIDAGLFLSDIHCATADDDATTPHDPNDSSCRHWMGSAPDIGPFEYGLDTAGAEPSTSPPKVPTSINLILVGN